MAVKLNFLVPSKDGNRVLGEDVEKGTVDILYDAPIVTLHPHLTQFPRFQKIAETFGLQIDYRSSEPMITSNRARIEAVEIPETQSLLSMISPKSLDSTANTSVFRGLPLRPGRPVALKAIQAPFALRNDWADLERLLLIQVVECQTLSE